MSFVGGQVPMDLWNAREPRLKTRRKPGPSKRSPASCTFPVSALVGEATRPNLSNSAELSLRVLEPLASTLVPVLLPFFHTGITCQEAFLSQAWTQCLIARGKGSCNPVTNGTGLPCDPAPRGRRQDVKAIIDIRRTQRLADNRLQSQSRKVFFKWPAVDGNLPGTRQQANSGNRFLPAAGTTRDGLDAHCVHLSTLCQPGRPLGLMTFLGTPIDSELAEHCTPQGRFRKHPLYRLHDKSLWLQAQKVPHCYVSEPARVTRVVVDDLLLAFPTRELYLFRIDDDHGIARIEMRCIGWLVLSSQYTRDSRCKASKHDAVGVDGVPGSPISISGRDNSLHPSTSWE